MIKLYDIAKDDEWHPYLIEVKSFDVDKNITTTNDGIIDLLISHLHLDVLDAERVFLVALDMYDRTVGIYLIGIGDYKSSEIYNRTVALTILLSGARKFFVAHNHPDGALFLSEDDRTIVMTLTVLSQILKVEFLNSYVITKEGYIHDKMKKGIMFKKRR